MWKAALAIGAGIALLEIFLRLVADAAAIAIMQIVCVFGVIC